MECSSGSGSGRKQTASQRYCGYCVPWETGPCVFAHTLDRQRRVQRPVSKCNLISFCKEGGRSLSSRSSGVLAMANDWCMAADVGSRALFPVHVPVTSLRPDIVLWSNAARVIILIELTVPWESHVAEARERKLTKYSELVEECSTNGWKLFYMPVEAGCRGFIATSVWRMTKLLGISSAARKEMVKAATSTSDRNVPTISRRMATLLRRSAA